MQRYEGMKVWLEYYNNPLGYKFDAKWDFIEGRNDYFLIIYCNTALYDFDKGIGLSNIFKDDSVTFYSWSERKSTIEVTISGIEYPHLCIYKHNDPSRYTQRYTEENTWSEIDSYEFINWDP